MADGSSFLYKKFVPESWYKNICILVANRTIQVSRTRNMADDRDDGEYILIKISIFFQETTP